MIQCLLLVDPAVVAATLLAVDSQAMMDLHCTDPPRSPFLDVDPAAMYSTRNSGGKSRSKSGGEKLIDGWRESGRNADDADIPSSGKEKVIIVYHITSRELVCTEVPQKSSVLMILSQRKQWIFC
jgi:hypothetical protein